MMKLVFILITWYLQHYPNDVMCYHLFLYYIQNSVLMQFLLNSSFELNFVSSCFYSSCYKAVSTSAHSSSMAAIYHSGSVRRVLWT